MKKYLFVSLALFVLWLLSRSNYLLFHSIIEMFAISVALNIFYVGVFSQKICKNNFLVKISHLYLMVAFIDLVHTLAYKGLGVFKSWTANQPTQLWILGRTIETFGLSIAVLFPKIKRNFLTALIFTFGALGLLAVSLGFFPDCFVEGKGLTIFKVAMEYVLVAILVPTAIAVYKAKNPEIVPVRKSIFAAFLLTAAAELSFTLYADVYGFFNMFGHLIRFLSYFVILDGMIIKSFVEPVKVLAYSLEEERHRYKELSDLDPLTSLYNRRFLNQWLEEHAVKFAQNGRTVVVMMDLDGFKKINDERGHLHGDEVLKFFGDLLKRNTRSSDIAVRYGGDEFLVVLMNTNLDGAREFVERIQKILNEENPFDHPSSFSYGIHSLDSDYVQSLHEADQLLYEMKRTKKVSGNDRETDLSLH
ncbi:MAG: GGDEF domain-containing protein [Pseudothermotoga sp.]|nr:GGDEF domain-containing protein [Pseudothermotoga sp.]